MVPVRGPQLMGYRIATSSICLVSFSKNDQSTSQCYLLKYPASLFWGDGFLLPLRQLEFLLDVGSGMLYVVYITTQQCQFCLAPASSNRDIPCITEVVNVTGATGIFKGSYSHMSQTNI